jgi:hypothetical protein
MDIKTLKAIVPYLPPEIAVLMRGPTGIGKSHVAKTFADVLELPFIDVRGSTMDEAKVGGLPDMKAVDEKKVASFVVPSWFKTASPWVTGSNGPKAPSWMPSVSSSSRPSRRTGGSSPLM